MDSVGCDSFAHFFSRLKAELSVLSIPYNPALCMTSPQDFDHFFEAATDEKPGTSALLWICCPLIPCIAPAAMIVYTTWNSSITNILQSPHAQTITPKDPFLKKLQSKEKLYKNDFVWLTELIQNQPNLCTDTEKTIILACNKNKKYTQPFLHACLNLHATRNCSFDTILLKTLEGQHPNVVTYCLQNKATLIFDNYPLLTQKTIILSKYYTPLFTFFLQNTLGQNNTLDDIILEACNHEDASPFACYSIAKHGVQATLLQPEKILLTLLDNLHLFGHPNAYFAFFEALFNKYQHMINTSRILHHCCQIGHYQLAQKLFITHEIDSQDDNQKLAHKLLTTLGFNALITTLLVTHSTLQMPTINNNILCYTVTYNTLSKECQMLVDQTGVMPWEIFIQKLLECQDEKLNNFIIPEFSTMNDVLQILIVRELMIHNHYAYIQEYYQKHLLNKKLFIRSVLLFYQITPQQCCIIHSLATLLPNDLYSYFYKRLKSHKHNPSTPGLTLLNAYIQRMENLFAAQNKKQFCDTTIVQQVVSLPQQ